MATSSSSSVVLGIPLPQTRRQSSVTVKCSVPPPIALTRWQGGIGWNNNTSIRINKKKKKKKSNALKAWKWNYPVVLLCCSSLKRNEKSCFPLKTLSGNRLCTPCATIQKQDFDSLYPQLYTAELEGFLATKLPSNPKLHRGQLKNGLRYIILPNKVPPNRFEAHMEVHLGSIDEEDDEQGIAHMIEHVAFLGSKKREKLLGTGACLNAYTDFHHTVFHIHSPTCTKDPDEDLLPLVLDALKEITFHPKFLSSRVEKERCEILSELQMMNTIEYLVDCQLLQHLHSENKLSKRFPTGLEERIKKWDADKIRKFHERWYFPGNATLYIVGDIDNIQKTVYQIEAVFGQTGVENEINSPPTSSAFGAMASFLVPKLSAGLAGSLSHERSSNSADQSKIIKRERHAVRPPVKHNWSLPGHHTDMKSPQIFQHELLQNISINLFCKIPVNKVRTFGDLKNVLMKRIFLSALHFQINTRYKSSNPPFTSVELDHSDSGREGCTVTTLTVTAEPQNWQSAIKVAVQEVRRLKEFGVTKGELTRCMNALLKDSEQLSAMIDNVSSVDNLDFIMESDALGHTVMDQRQGHESLMAVGGTVTLDEVNSIGAQVLEFISDFGKPTAPLPAVIVACFPKKVHVDGIGETEFKITSIEITAAIKSGLEEPIEAEPELEVPKELISPLQLQELRMQRSPSFIPLSPETDVTKVQDKETGITQHSLSNRIPVNYKVNSSEGKKCAILFHHPSPKTITAPLPPKPPKIPEIPSIPSSNLPTLETHSDFQEKMLYLDSNGLDFFSLIQRHPPIISTCLDDLKSTIDFLISMNFTAVELRRIISMCPEILTSKPSSLLPVFTFLLREACITGSALKKVINRRPRLLVCNVETQLRPTLYFLQNIGISEVKKHTCLLSCSVENKLIPRLEYFQKIGFSYKQTISMFRRFPQLFNYSVKKNYEPKLNYFVVVMGRDLKEIEEFPQYFSFSLENRIKPRHQCCIEKGVCFPLPVLLKTSEVEFRNRLEVCCNSTLPLKTSPLWCTKNCNVEYSI